MAEFDSLSFALLIPFAICFVLVFIVCCFADEIKDICRMPSPLPSSYLAVERTRPNRRNSRRQGRQGRPQNEEIRNLILSEEGRSRNVSESSTEYNQVTNLLANSNLSIVRQPGVSLHQNVMLLPQTTLLAGSQATLQTESERIKTPCTNCIISRPEVHGSITHPGTQRIIIQPLGQFAAKNTSRNNNKHFSRNLAIHASASSKDIGTCLKQDSKSCDCESNTHNSQRADLNRNGSAPELLNNYLINGSTSTPSAMSSHTSNTLTAHTSNTVNSHTSDTSSAQTTNTVSAQMLNNVSLHTLNNVSSHTSNTLSSEASEALSSSKQETESSQSDQLR